MNTESRQVKKGSKVYLLDRSPVVLLGLTEVVHRFPDLQVGWSGVEPPKFFEAIEKEMPDIVVLDLLLHNCDGLEVIKQLNSRWPALPILVAASVDERVYCERALRAGAQGFIMKTESTENIARALREVLRGEMGLSDEMKKRLIGATVGKKNNAVSPLDCLTDRELEVFTFFGEGYSTKKIAEHLGLSSKTIDSYRHHIKEKLNIQKVNELVMLASHWSIQRKQLTDVEAVPIYEKAG